MTKIRMDVQKAKPHPNASANLSDTGKIEAALSFAWMDAGLGDISKIAWEELCKGLVEHLKVAFPALCPWGRPKPEKGNDT